MTKPRLESSGLGEALDALDSQGEIYRAFVAEIRALAETYRIKQICQRLEPHVSKAGQARGGAASEPDGQGEPGEPDGSDAG